MRWNIDQRSSSIDAEAESKIDVFTGRILIDTRFDLWVFNLGIGLDLEIPLADTGAELIAVSDEALSDDFTEALDQKSADSGFGLMIDVGYKF